MTDNKIGYHFLGSANRFLESIGFNFARLLEVAEHASLKTEEELNEYQLKLVSETIESMLEEDSASGRTKEGILEELKKDKLRALMFLIEVQSDALINLVKESVIIMQERGYIPAADDKGMIIMDQPLEEKLIKPN